MSGVGITGLIANLAGTVTPYPTQNPSLELGGFQQTATLASRDLIPANFRTIGMVVVTQDFGIAYQLVGGIANANWQLFCTANSAAVATVANWYVDSVNGSDTLNTGQSVGSPFKTVEHLSQVMCPGGTAIYLQQSTNIFLAAGSYGSLDLNVKWSPATTFYGSVLSIIGAISSTANITLATATAQNAGARTRGELTTASGTFVNRARIRQTSGTQTGSLAWSSGLNGSALDTFIGPWINFANNSQAGPVAGNTVVVDTLLSTIAQLNVQSSGLGYWQIKDCILNSVAALALGPTTTGGGKAPYVDGCLIQQATGGFDVVQSFGGIDLYSCFVKGMWLYGDDFEMRGCTLNGNNSLESGTFLNLGVTILDAGTISLASDNRGGYATIKTSDNVEHENGAGLTAYTLAAGCMMICGGSQHWGAASGGTYAVGLSLASGAWVGVTAAATISFPSTTNYSITGHAIAYAGIPLGYPRANCGVFLNNDPAAVAVTT